MGLTEELKNLLYQNGAELVGVADMNGIEHCTYPVGVSVAIALPKHTIRDLQTAPTKEYHALYHEYNDKLNEIVTIGERFLQQKHYEAYAQTTKRIRADAKRLTPVPHKTVATRAGLGWIGKNCLLVTPEYGSAVRISSLLTNAPIVCAEAIVQSRCGNCSLCVKQCPAQALHGAVWSVDMCRGEIMDVEKCYKKQMEIMLEATGIQQDLCGRCFAVCAYTQRYLRNP